MRHMSGGGVGGSHGVKETRLVPRGLSHAQLEVYNNAAFQKPQDPNFRSQTTPKSKVPNMAEYPDIQIIQEELGESLILDPRP